MKIKKGYAFNTSYVKVFFKACIEIPLQNIKAQILIGFSYC